MTEKLYYGNQYIKEFSAEIINVIEKDSEYHIELDKTAFFPEMKLKLWDTGSIEDCLITYVYEKAGIIYHVSNKKPIKIHRVKCKINWDTRFDAMQQMLGKHILASIFLEVFHYNVTDFKLENEYCTLNIDKILNQEELEEIEQLSNKKIFEDKNVDFLYPTKSEIKKLFIKRDAKNMDNQGLRVVKVEDMNIEISNYLYPKSTIEVQLIKLKKIEKLKGNIMKIEFLCGNRAIQDALKIYSFSNKICGKLNCDKEEALIKVGTIASDFNLILAENKNMKSQIADYQVQEILNNCEKVGQVRIVKTEFKEEDVKYINMLSLKLTAYENVVVLYALKNQGLATLMFMCSKNLKALNMNDLLKDAITLIDGKGGGSTFSAQGGGKNINNLNSAMDYAFDKIKNIVSAKGL